MAIALGTIIGDYLVSIHAVDFQVYVTVANDEEALMKCLRAHDELEGLASHLTFVSAETGREF